MVVTITPNAYRAAMAARAQQQEGDEQSAGEGGAQLAAASFDAAADDDMNASPSKTKASATLIVAGKKSEEAQATALPEDTAGDDVAMSSSPQPSSAAAAIAAASKSGGAVNTAPQEDATMEPGEIPSMEERPSATSNVAESKSESGMPSPSLSQYERLDDPQIPVHKLVHYEGEGSSGDDDDDLDDRRDQARSSGNASPLEEKQSVKNWPLSPHPNYSPMDDRRSEYSPPYSVASSGGSTRSHDRPDRGGQSRQHDRDDRAEPMVITNVTQRDEDRQLRRNEPELYPWMPSRRDLQLLNGYRSSQYPLALFDGGPLHQDPRIAQWSWHDQRNYLVDIFFRSRWYRGSRSNDRSATALVQAWDQFVTNVNYAGGIVAWESKLLASRKKFEEHSEVGARSRIHRISREAGLPCFVWGNCPQCLPGADHAPAHAYTGEDREWNDRIPRELWDAIRNAEQIAERAERARASAAADAQGASGGTRRIVRRAQGRPAGAPHVAPNCPPKADSHAIERDTSFEYHPADPYGSASPPRSTARSRGSPSAAVAAAGRSPPRGGSVGTRPLQHDEAEQLRRDLAQERSDRMALALVVANQRADLAELKLQHQRMASELETLTRRYKTLHENLERAGVLKERKKARVDDTDGADRRKT